MKKLLAILLILLAPGVAWGADWYSCSSTITISDANSTANGACLGAGNPYTCCTGVGTGTCSYWADAASGSCACVGATQFLTWASVGATDNLYANGCTALALPDANFTAAKISTEDGDGVGAGVAGGGFTLATATASGNNYTTNIVSGTSVCLVITGNGAGNTITGSVTGGSGSSIYGVQDGHTIGDMIITANVTGGSGATSAGYYFSGNSGTVSVGGTATAGSASNAHGLYTVGDGTSTVLDCTGSNTNTGAGCVALGAGAITVTGNITSQDSGAGHNGRIKWVPGALSNYIVLDGGGTPIFASKAPAAANVAVGTSTVDFSDGSFDAGTKAGGGAWAN